MRINKTLLLPVACLLAGCFRYTPVAVENVPPGSSIRAHLSAGGAQALADLPATDERLIEGEFRGFDDGMLTVTLSSAPVRMGYGGGALSQSITIPRDDLLALELRELDRARTAGLVAIAAAGVAALAIQIFSGETRVTDRDPPPTGPVEVRVPPVFQR